MYATREDIERLYGGAELRAALNLARDAVLDAAALARVDEALMQADSQIDAYIAVRYVVPLETVPDVLRTFACDLTLYRLALTSGKPRAELRKRYEDAIGFLKAVSKGEAMLPGLETAAEVTSAASENVQVVSFPRRIDRDSEVLS